MSGSLARLGVIDEVTYGTAVAVTRGFDFLKEDIKGNFERLQSESLSASLVDRSDRFEISPKGAAGSVEMEVLTKGFGWWLKHMLGTVTTTGPTETSVYTHTAVPATLWGDSFTLQVARPKNDDVLVPATYEGGKIKSWEIAGAVDQLVRAKFDMDFETETIGAGAGAYALANPTYPSGARVMSWANATITIGGTTHDVVDCMVKVDNAVKDDRYFMRRGQGKGQPVRDGKVKIEWAIRLPYDTAAAAHIAKIVATDPANTLAEIVMKFEGAALLGTTVYPNLTITIPAARFDEGIPTVESASMLEMPLTGVGLWNGTDDAIEVVYQSADATP